MTTQHNIKKTHIPIFRNRLPGVAAIILELLFQNSEGAVVVMWAKVTLTKNFSIKTLYIKNGNALPILTLELWMEKSNDTRNMTCINFATKKSSIIMISERYYEKQVFYKKAVLNISQYWQENTCAGVFF